MCACVRFEEKQKSFACNRVHEFDKWIENIKRETKENNEKKNKKKNLKIKTKKFNFEVKREKDMEMF